MECPFSKNQHHDDLRDLYLRGLNAESYPSAASHVIDYAQRAMRSVKPDATKLFSSIGGQSRLLARETLRAEIYLTGDVPACLDEDQLRHALLQFAPLMRIDGAHLAGVSALKFAGRESGAALLRIHSRAVGAGDLGKSRAAAFDYELQQVGVHLPAAYTAESVLDLRIEESAFKLPLFLLGLAQAPDRFFAETLGVNLALSLANPISVVCRDRLRLWSILRESVQNTDEDDAELAIHATILELSENGLLDDGFFRQVHLGFAALTILLREFVSDLAKALTEKTRFNSQGKFLAILERIGTRPYGYHKRGKMGGQPIDDWFMPGRFEPLDVLRALAKSPYVVPGAPERSRMLTQLTQARGPMYRIFSDQELDVIAEWIRELPPSRELLADGPLKTPALMVKRSSQEIEANLADEPQADLREMYFRLVNEYENRHYWPRAYRFARKWLDSHERGLKKNPSLVPFEHYSHASLDHWLDKKHDEQVNSYHPLESCPEEAKEDVIHTAVQLAPLTMIDGAWLRAFVSAELVNTRVGSLLYHIYIDELGNGDTATHHGNIYRDLVASMGYDLPPFTSRDFARLKLFEDESFEVPVFWLSISLFPRQFMPEILGLNLAMELSGVGGEYRRSGDVLRHYGFSAQFTELHNSIDNVATGHTAWAIDAIKVHLDEMNLRGGASEADRHWRRVWIGYRSLQPPQRRPLLIEALSRIFQ